MSHDFQGLKESWQRAGVLGVLRFFTLEQWAAIDREYLEASRGTRLSDVALMGLVAVTLTLQKYFGSRKTLEELVGAATLRALPWPDMWHHVYWAWFSSLTYMVPPMLFAWWVHREKPADYGLSLKGARPYAWLYVALFLGVLPAVVVASGSDAFLNRYPFYQAAGRSWPQFLIWELSYGFQFLALEYFFRGFMLFPLARRLGAAAIFVMVIPYTMIHFSKPLPETLGAVLAGTALGTLALRTRSIFGGVAIHLAVAWSMDVLALLRKGTLTGLFSP
ncbi:MAG: type II CAAX prenyl endopeptidase Rce1 family protein [Myxococcota bacterium]